MKISKKWHHVLSGIHLTLIFKKLANYQKGTNNQKCFWKFSFEIVSFTLSTNKKCYELINLSRGEDY
jgi:hypothetical protein